MMEPNAASSNDPKVATAPSLDGLRVLVTRAKAQQGVLAGRLSTLGADVVALPTVRFLSLADTAPVRAAIERIETYDWVVFTSVNGVSFFVDALERAGRDAQALSGVDIAAVGQATDERLGQHGLKAAVLPDAFVAESLVGALRSQGMSGRRLLLPRAEVAREVVPQELRAAGAQVDVVPVYRTTLPDLTPQELAVVTDHPIDLITFTASSTVRQLCELLDAPVLQALKQRARVACIGPITARTAREAGFDVALVSPIHTIPGLVDALVNWHEKG